MKIAFFYKCTLKNLNDKFQGMWGLRQVFMALMDWATHVLQ